MQIQKLDWRDGTLDMQKLVTLAKAGNAKLEVGIVTFPEGKRIPEEGFSVHEQTEVGFIMEGEFELYTPGKVTRVGPGNLVTLPAGLEHANLALSDARVLFILFGADQG